MAAALIPRLVPGPDWPSRLAAAGCALVLAAAAVVAGLTAAGMLRVVVEMSVYSVQIRHPMLPGPTATVPLRQILLVRAVQAKASPWTNWWWQGELTRRRAAVIRSGPALQLELVSGSPFVVSVDDPAEAVSMFLLLPGGTADRR
jgi:hypothetical protein